MTKFDDRPADLFDWDSATPLERGQAAHDELVASEVLRVEPMAPPRPPRPPQVKRINRALVALPLLVLALVVVLLLSGCKSGGDGDGVATPNVSATRAAQFSAVETADARGVAVVVPTETTPTQPIATPESPQSAPIEQAPTVHTLNAFVTPIEPVEVTQ